VISAAKGCVSKTSLLYSKESFYVCAFLQLFSDAIPESRVRTDRETRRNKRNTGKLRA
jgi:hypothetical protein